MKQSVITIRQTKSGWLSEIEDDVKVYPRDSTCNALGVKHEDDLFNPFYKPIKSLFFRSKGFADVWL